MKTKKMTSGIVALFLMAVLLFACKKQEAYVDLQVDNTVAIKNAIQQFSQTFTKTCSESERKSVGAIIQNLEYRISAMMSLGDTATLYVVKINQDTSTTEKFMAVIQQHGEYGFDGLYEAKNITALKSVFTMNKLPKGDSVYVRGFDGYPTKEWITNSNGTLTYRVARSSKIKDIEKLKQTVLSDAKYKLDFVSEPCVFWYWWEFFPGYGWIPVDFLYSTGCNEQGLGGNGEGPEEIDPEPMYQQMIEGYAESTAEDQSFSASSSSADGIDPVAGTHSWIVGKHLFGEWSVNADTKYIYYHTQYFDANLMRMVQNYDATYYKTEAINFIGSNYLIKSKWTTTTLSDNILNNNTEDAEGKTVVTGLITHSMRIKFKYKGIDFDKTISSNTKVDAVQLELKFN